MKTTGNYLYNGCVSSTDGNLTSNQIVTMSTIKQIFLVGMILFSAIFCANAQKPIHGVIITGQNNHNWPVSHMAIKMTLENSKLFSLDDFNKYELVVLDYNGYGWSSVMNKAFMDYVRNGGGVVVFHAADNAFVQPPKRGVVL